MLPVRADRPERRRAWASLGLYVLGVAAVAAVLALGLSAAWQGTFDWLKPQFTADSLPD